MPGTAVVFVTGVVAAALLIGPPPAAAQPAAGRDPLLRLGGFSDALEALAERVSPSIVQVVATGYGGVELQGDSALATRQRQGGSGVIVDASGYIVTNAHVVAAARRVQVVLPQRVAAGHPRDRVGPGLRDRLPTPRMPGGVLVAARAADAPAGDQMPLPGDIITAINGTPIAGMPDLREALAAVSPRSPCVLQVQRGDRLMFLVLDLD